MGYISDLMDDFLNEEIFVKIYFSRQEVMYKKVNEY